MKELGAILSASGSWMDGSYENERAKIISSQMRDQASNVRGASQRDAAEIRRQKRLALSRARAMAASQGGDTSDVGVQDAMADIERTGEYRALSALYNGGEQAAQLRNQAKAIEGQGKAARTRGFIRGASTIFAGASDSDLLKPKDKKKGGIDWSAFYG